MKITCLIMGFALILWGGMPLNGKPADLNYQIIASSIGIVLCCASFAFYVLEKIDNLKK